LETDQKSTDNEKSSEGRTQKTSEKDRYQETVSGASRNSSSPNPSKNSRDSSSSKDPNKVQINNHDKEVADSWGLSLKEFARRKKHLESSRDEYGYAPIIIPKN